MKDLVDRMYEEETSEDDDELLKEIFSFIKPAENENNPCNSDGYNENEIYRAVREVILKYKNQIDNGNNRKEE